MVRRITRDYGAEPHDLLAQTLAAKVAVLAASDHKHNEAVSKLALELGLTLVGPADAERYRYLLVLTPERLELRDNRDRRTRPLWVGISSLRVRPHGSNLSRHQPLARAVGVHTNTVVDTTAGLGQDAFLLARMGYTVTAIERSPILAALLRDGWSRARNEGTLHTALGDRLTVLSGDARQLLPKIRPRPDVIYMDPMFPPKRKHSALARRTVRVVRDLAGNDEDALELLGTCLGYARSRVVAKRPHYAPPLAANPSASYKGKLVRYDVYFAKAQSSSAVTDD